MANVWAIKSGDWSDTTVWNTGALPTSADDVYANNFNVNVNQNITVNSLRNTANTGITAGGIFYFNTGGVTANINDNLYMHNITQFIIISASSGEVLINAVSSILKPVGTNGSVLINHSGSCNLTINALRLMSTDVIASATNSAVAKSSVGLLTINAEIRGSNQTSTNAKTVFLSSASTTVINGNVIGGSGSGTSAIAISINLGNLIINGNVIGGSGTLGGLATINSSTSGNISITGNVIGDVSRSIYAIAGTITIVGNITGGNTNGLASVFCSGASINHIGTVQASASSSGIACDTPTTSTVTCTGPFLRNGYIVAIASQTLRINFGSNSYFQFKKSNGEDIDYVSTIEGYNYPTPADVRYGVEYKSGLAIGTCHVPTPDNVRKNIPVDNTVGTSDNVNAEDILQAIQDSTLPIAQRLRNVATVESTGAQLEAYQ